MDVVKTRVQATPLEAASGAGGTLAAVRTMAEAEGWRVFGRGLTARAFKIGLGQAVTVGTYDLVRQQLRR